jgi:hypothetical protein
MTKPLSREYLISIKKCCGRRCVNCPYIPKWIRGNSKIDARRNNNK